MSKSFLKESIAATRIYFSNRPLLKLISINTGWLVGDKLLRLFIGLFVSAWVARYLGPEEFGKLAYVVAFLAIFQAFSLLGLDNIVVRNIARTPKNAYQILGTTLRVRLISSIISFIVACTTVYFIRPGDAEFQVLVILVGFGLIFQTADVVDLWFQSQSQSKRTVLAKAISYVFAATFKVFLIAKSAPLWLFAASIGGETVLTAIALYFSYKKYPVLKTWKWDSVVAKEMLSRSFPLLLSSLSIIIYMKSSQLIINELLDSTAVGIYATAQTISELWYFLPMTLATSVAPMLARKKLDSEHAYMTALKNVFGLMWIISIAIAIGISFLSGLIVAILFGEAYRSSALILSIHIFSLIPVCIGVTQSLWLINENKSYIALYQAIAGAISSLGLNYLLISEYGVIGGAYATVISQFIQAFAINALIAPTLFKLQVNSLLILPSTISKAIYLISNKMNSR